MSSSRNNGADTPACACITARTSAAEDLTTIDRIPVTRPARMLVDLNDTLTPHQLANVIHRCAYRGLFSAAATRDVIARTRRTKTIERALALHESGSAGTRSHNEDRFLA